MSRLWERNTRRCFERKPFVHSARAVSCQVHANDWLSFNWPEQNCQYSRRCSNSPGNASNKEGWKSEFPKAVTTEKKRQWKELNTKRRGMLFTKQVPTKIPWQTLISKYIRVFNLKLSATMSDALANDCCDELTARSRDNSIITASDLFLSPSWYDDTISDT